MVRQKHVPLRTCVSCRLKTAKRDLLRVVSPPDGAVSVDSGGKRNGRGAYLCAACRGSERGLNRGRLEHSLRTKIGEDDWAKLLATLSANPTGDRG